MQGVVFTVPSMSLHMGADVMLPTVQMLMWKGHLLVYSIKKNGGNI
jgi:hypothetical protein